MAIIFGLALVLLGASVMTPRATDKVLNAERRYGPSWQRRAANTPRRRVQVRVISAVVGTGFIAAGVLSMVGIAEPAVLQ